MNADKQKKYFIYVLLCCNGSYYTGYSDDPYKRFEKHKSGKGAKYTKAFPPKKILMVGPPMSKSDAMRAEAMMKRLSKKQKLEVITWYNNFKEDPVQFIKKMFG